MQLVSLGSTRGEANFHLVFTPKYRRDVFRDGEVRRACLESFGQTCHALGIRIEACEFGPDHVHVFLSGCKNHSVPEMAQRLKGASAHRVRHEMWERVKGKLWGDSFWSDGYFYRSVGSTTAEAVRYYVQNSQRKHWTKRDHETQGKEEGEAQHEQQARLDEF
jgi:putative transposase